MSTIYKLSLKLKSGLLTDLQSDTIFGHFCWRLQETKGEDVLSEFIGLYLQNKPVFTASNSFISDKKNIYLPKPLIPEDIQYSEKQKQHKVIDFLKHKAKKKLSFLTLNEFNFYLNKERKEPEKLIEKRYSNNNKSPSFNSDLRVSVGIDRNTYSSKKGQLFSYAPKYLNKEYHLIIFIKEIDKTNFEKYECEKILKEVFEIGFGKKKSSGYGEFDMNSYKFEEFNDFKEPDDANAFITLSNYLPSNDDEIENANYDFFVKYGKLGEEYALSLNPFKKPIILFKPGSIFKTKVIKEFYGRCTKSGEISTIENVIQNGFAFSLKMKI